MYVILGASGHTGAAAAETLLAKKQPVRVVVRSAEKGAPWKARGAEVAIADVDNQAALTAAFQGAKGAYVLVPPDLGSPDALARGRRVSSALAGALAAAKVPHVVLLSSVGAHQPEGTGLIRSLHDSEQRLGAMGAALTAVRAAYFMENWSGLIPVAAQNGILPTALTLDRKIAMVATKDIGEVAAGALLDPPAAGRKKVIELGGPVDLSPNDVAAILGGLLGKPVPAVPIGMEDLEKAILGMGASADVAALFVEMNQGINGGQVGFEGQGAVPMRGTTDLATVLRGLLSQGGRPDSGHR